MTDREKAIVMAHTGICMLTGEKFQIFHKYVENIMGRPIMTHEIGWLADAIKEKSKDDFIALCEGKNCSESLGNCDLISREETLTAFADYVGSGMSMNDYDALWDIVAKMPSAQPACDCIDRQAVNTLVDELARAISDERCCISRGRSTATIMRDILHLPPVTPQSEKHTDKRTEKHACDYISRKDAINAIENEQRKIMRSDWAIDQAKFTGMNEVRALIANLPSVGNN